MKKEPVSQREITPRRREKKKLVFTKIVQMVVKVSFFFVSRVCDAVGPSLFIWLRREMTRDELGDFYSKLA